MCVWEVVGGGGDAVVSNWWDDVSAQVPSPFRTEVVDRTVVRRQMAVGSWSRSTFRTGQRYVDEFQDLVLSVEAELLRQELPPVQVTEHADVELVRPAGWVDHLKLSVAGRWWASWWVRWRPARVVAIPHRLTVVVDLERFRTFPDANGDPGEWDWLGGPRMVVRVRTSSCLG